MRKRNRKTSKDTGIFNLLENDTRQTIKHNGLAIFIVAVFNQSRARLRIQLFLQTDRHTDRQTDLQTDRQTSRQTHRQTHRPA
jgi:hypothetical protein